MITVELILKTILRYMVIIIPAIVVLGIVLVLGTKRGLLDTVKGNLKFWKRKFLILGLGSVVYLGIAAGSVYLQSKLEPSVTIFYNYPEASRGLNPNGTKFTAMNDILPDAVMEGLIEVCGLDPMTPEELKAGFTVTPLNINKEVSLEQPYVATEFKIQYHASSEWPEVDPEAVISAFPELYREYFTDSYSMNTSVLQLDFDSLDQVDYPDVSAVLSSMATNVQVYLSSCSSENRGFVSEQTGESFASLNQKINNFTDVALENYWAFILKNGLSKDKGQYVAKLNYDNRISNNDYLKNIALYQIYLEVVEMYERDMATIVLVPTRDENGEFYMSRTKLGVDDFSKGAEAASEKAAELSLEIAGNNHTITRLLQSETNAAAVSEAEDMIAALKTELSELADTAIQTVEEYEETSANQYFTVLAGDEEEKAISMAATAVKQTLLFFVLFFIFQMLMPAMKKGKGRRNQSV